MNPECSWPPVGGANHDSAKYAPNLTKLAILFAAIAMLNNVSVKSYNFLTGRYVSLGPVIICRRKVMDAPMSL
jgi:hypothetical protein